MTHETADEPNRTAIPRPPSVGMVSLGCPKALVDSERILTRLRAEGYTISPDYAGADAVIVNTCGFLDSARAESLDAIGEALAENGRVIVTGCMGADESAIREAHPRVLAVTGPHQYEQVLDAVHEANPRPHEPFLDLLPPQGLRLTPRHYAWLKISEGCNHKCAFCIIPQLRGKLASRPVRAVLREAEKLAEAGVRELLVISQDTSAYGRDIRHAPGDWRGTEYRAHIKDLSEGLASLGLWTRLHYVYPYKQVDDLIPLMSTAAKPAGLLPYLDIPFQHSHPDILRRMARPAASENTLERIRTWRSINPDIAIRSTFIVGFPGETEAEFEHLLGWLEEARLDRVGCFVYENIEGAPANALANHVDPEVAAERQARFMEVSARISAEKLEAKVGTKVWAILDEVEEDEATGRTVADAPEIDGRIFVEGEGLKVGDIVEVEVTGAEEHDLWGEATT
ncbi:MAG: 30S ribosomal protein S12 methylthiotransferase RimO [Rhodobacteraceae bacterium]|nr:30S ribosomal protein S12 methylthiotransferase RimO [Paracoccaceae bacterium]